MFVRVILILATIEILYLGSTSAMASATLAPQPGDVYREYRQVMLDNTWRVVDPNTKRPGARVDLPNPIHHIIVTDLTEAVRAEAVIDFWGGHYRTSEKRIRFNGNTWMPLPELTTTPPGQLPSSYMQQFNPVIEVPLSHLKVGDNTFEGICGDQLDGFGWGQWGWYGMILRVYYGPSKPHPIGRITAPIPGSTLGENPVISVAAGNPAGITRIDVLGYYEGLDENGDGIFRDWHHNYHYTSISGHIGTVTSAPYEVIWDTQWVPDQPASMALLARLQDRDGIWYVTEAVGDLRLMRADSTVKLYPASGVPILFSVRDDASRSCTITLPEKEELSLAREAALHLRTWNGYEESVTLNNWSSVIGGANHNYASNLRPVPTFALQPGRNTVTFHAVTVHHGVEVLWPGPILLVRYAKRPSPSLEQPYYLPISVSAVGYQRCDVPVEVEVDFTSMLQSVEATSALNEASLKVVEVGVNGEILDLAVPFQFDKDLDYDGATKTKGTLVFLLKGTTAPEVTRYYSLYFDEKSTRSYSAPTGLTHVRITDGIIRAGQESFRIETDGATYYYHKAGAGFASLEDNQGHDWISFQPGGGPAGEYRGIPNLVYPESHFHPGRVSSRSRIVSAGPVKVRIHSETLDGKWSCAWDVYPNYASMTLLKADHPYWFLYEGTPAGELDVTRDYWVRYDGESGPLSQEWVATLPAHPWISFHKPGTSTYALFLARNDAENTISSYWPMQGKMAVFGFGRQDEGEPHAYLTRVPARFTFGLTPSNYPETRTVVEAAVRELRIIVGAPKAVAWGKM